MNIFCTLLCMALVTLSTGNASQPPQLKGPSGTVTSQPSSATGAPSAGATQLATRVQRENTRGPNCCFILLGLLAMGPGECCSNWFSMRNDAGIFESTCCCCRRSIGKPCDEQFCMIEDD